MSVVPFVDEIVLDISEALSGWSPIQLEAQAAQVRFSSAPCWMSCL